MKVALAHYSARTDISGVTTWLIGFCARLKQAGHEVVIHLHHFGYDTSKNSILSSLQSLGIETHVVRRTGSLEADTLHTLQFLNRVQPDLFLPQCLHAHFVAAAHAGCQGLPWIFTMHSDDPDYWCIAESLTPENNGGASVCVSQFLAQQLRKRLPVTKPQVIACGITLPTAQASFSDQPFRVVYSGRMVERQKCIHQVVNTLINACLASSQIEAHLIGDGAELAACKQRVRQAGLAGRIKFHGRITPDQVQPLLQRSQAILLMSDFEGLPVALLEAMAAGVVPVVRAIESGIPELVLQERTGLLVGNDPAEAAASLVRLSGDSLLWQRCSTNSRALVEEGYESHQCVEKWLAVIKEQCAATRPAFPICTTDLRQTIPFADPRFCVEYSQAPTLWSRLHPRRLLGRMLQGVALMMPPS